VYALVQRCPWYIISERERSGSPGVSVLRSGTAVEDGLNHRLVI
jgi:hypothetical protein